MEINFLETFKPVKTHEEAILDIILAEAITPQQFYYNTVVVYSTGDLIAFWPASKTPLEAQNEGSYYEYRYNTIPANTVVIITDFEI